MAFAGMRAVGGCAGRLRVRPFRRSLPPVFFGQVLGVIVAGAILGGLVIDGPGSGGPVAGTSATAALVSDGSVPGPPPSEAPPDAGSAAPPRPPGAGLAAPGARYAWPLLPAPEVARPFRAPPHPYGPGHRGADLAGTAGQPVLAARAGAVVFAGPVAGRGVVSVQHDDGLRTTYEPVQARVAAGAVVRAGDVIGLLLTGHDGCAPAVCLHWGVRRERLEYLDPLVLLRPPHVRLLPVPEAWPGPVRAPPRPAARRADA